MALRTRLGEILRPLNAEYGHDGVYFFDFIVFPHIQYPLRDRSILFIFFFFTAARVCCIHCSGSTD